jgi:septal ring factor EnvC (AmiA/AmiB activator)
MINKTTGNKQVLEPIKEKLKKKHNEWDHGLDNDEFNCGVLETINWVLRMIEGHESASGSKESDKITNQYKKNGGNMNKVIQHLKNERVELETVIKDAEIELSEKTQRVDKLREKISEHRENIKQIELAILELKK